MIEELKLEIQSNLFLPNKCAVFLRNLPTPRMLRLPSQLVTKCIPSKLAEIVANIILFLSFLPLMLLKQIVTGTVMCQLENHEDYQPGFWPWNQPTWHSHHPVIIDSCLLQFQMREKQNILTIKLIYKLNFLISNSNLISFK